MTKKQQIAWVMDYETLKNFFCAVFTHYKTDETKVFIVHDLQNDFESFYHFLGQNIQNKEYHISFNGLNFDAQITEYILQYYEDWKDSSGCLIANNIYRKAQEVINKSKNREWFDFYEKDMHIPQVDVFRINHWDNAAKRSSLKWIQYSMDWENLQDMPIHHTEQIITMDQVDMIVGYCKNDVLSTKKILYKSSGQISLRKTLTKEYDINLTNASEPKIAKEIFLDLLSKEMGIKKYDLKQSRTIHSQVNISELILPYVNFKQYNLKCLHNYFKSVVVEPDKTKGALSYTVLEKDISIDFGLGGVHGATKPGIYKSSEDYVILSVDVKSYYPNLAIKNNWAPQHLDKNIFCKKYGWFYEERVLIPKSDIRNYVYKIILNGTFGLSNDKHSFLYDLAYFMSTTVNGQLSLMMLYEDIMSIGDVKPLMLNTDGLEMLVPRAKVTECIELCKKWETLTKLSLDYDTYEKLIIRDVNNYIGVHEFKEVSKDEYNDLLKSSSYPLIKKENDTYYHAKIKCKGQFEFENIPYHKNKSNLVSRKAVFNFFIHNVPPEKYLRSNKNIFDYCIGKKIKGNWEFVKKDTLDGKLNIEKVQPTIRYMITKKGCKIIKINKSDKREIQVESGRWMLTLFNKAIKKEWKDYNINDKYYLNAIYKEIENINGPEYTQTNLF